MLGHRLEELFAERILVLIWSLAETLIYEDVNKPVSVDKGSRGTYTNTKTPTHGQNLPRNFARLVTFLLAHC